MSRIVLITTFVLFLARPLAAAPVYAQPEGATPLPDWSAEECAKPIAVRTVRRSEFASTHLIRLQGAEPPHFHDRHDLAISVLAGHSVLHFAERTVALQAGDTAFIPRGAYHWAENTGPGASIVFAVFSPPFDGKDRRLAEEPVR